jgi:hypothetical protein
MAFNLAVGLLMIRCVEAELYCGGLEQALNETVLELGTVVCLNDLGSSTFSKEVDEGFDNCS